jgi:histidine ammonia-lyase
LRITGKGSPPDNPPACAFSPLTLLSRRYAEKPAQTRTDAPAESGEVTDLDAAKAEIAALKKTVAEQEKTIDEKKNWAMFKKESDTQTLGGGGVIMSGGNFHGEYPAKALDFLAIGVHELANISERRIERMCNPTLSNLPAFLVADGGFNSGFMIAHCTAAAMVSENKVRKGL